MTIFVDSSAFIALAVKSEQNNLSAKAFLNEFTPQVRLLTSNFVLDETVSHLNSRLGWQAAYEFGNEMLKSSLYEIVMVDNALFHEALNLLKKFGDHRLSFTDLTSFAIMRLHGINKAFSFDRDFLKVGFQLVP